MGKKGYNRLIYHSIDRLQTVIFVFQKLLSRFDGHSTSPIKGKRKHSKIKSMELWSLFDMFRELSGKSLEKASLIGRNWELHL